MFPQGLFYILSRKNGFALDVYDGQTKEDANIIVWPQKFEDSDNQLWTYEEGRLVNKKSGHVLDIRSSAFKKDKAIVQNKRKDKNQSQFWIFDQGFLCSQEYPSMVFDIKGDSDKGGAQVLLYKRKDTDNLNQQWYLEPYHNIESSLNMATKSIPLHKKEGFGQPRLGYGAEIGVPPELKHLPANIKVAGVSNNGPTASKPLPNPADQHSPHPEALNMNHQAPISTHSAPQAEPGYIAPPPRTSAYPPPPQAHYQQESSSSSNRHQDQPHYQQQGSNYPHPPPPSSSGYPGPPSSGYPASSTPQGMSSPGVGGFYVPQPNSPPPPSQMNMPSYPSPPPPSSNDYTYPSQ
ncbi:ricin B lectin domain-containing protein [Halteromyces radiatus]|uniref:ricin B lectin domain-containing protein n=1 Tax=Halteromyces radiatus TaxID=101107 RepID=UPI00221FDF94|nr:ricin B lectin domain-containing protein [Halteromyces radiatus]KAI8098523.1 ricin B lectin domain-containing protein [Halteromyces radiatus]